MSEDDTLPLISIVIPHYDRAELLAETLRSVEAQEYPNWEVIVVDDGSEPDQWTAIQHYAKHGIRILQRTDGTKGPSRCRNLGAAAAGGEYLVFLDSDDLLAPWCLAQRLKCARAEPQADFWIFQVLLFRESPGDMDICWNRLAGDDDLERFLRSDPPWHTTSPIWRKDAFLDLGGFNEKVMYGDDAELHTRALLRGLVYHKYPHWMPDVFIRRGDECRITFCWSQALIESRQLRLAEVAQLLVDWDATKEQTDTWEGQYFVECEALLFNVDSAQNSIRATLDAWIKRYRTTVWRRSLVRTYFVLGMLYRENAYWVVRLARRLAMVTLPRAYFPMGAEFQNWTLNEDVMHQVRTRLVSEEPQPRPAGTPHNASVSDMGAKSV